MSTVLVLLGGGLGSVARFTVGGLVDRRLPGKYPLGILVINLSGSFLLGLLVGLGANHRLQLLLGTAALGSYTTFSTWMLDARRAEEDGEPALAWGSVLIALAAGLLAVWLGRVLGHAL
ncbi:MAG TPA: fluoride efflux transporter CrcB [Solirubrobacteraceae bacterium]|nr:fluoride efflux transporter CrcB [Solirubrobacteraceae bacterium]